jgi:hypothetical protein
LLRQVEQITGILRQFAGCFTDHRDPELIEHPLEHLIAQRVYALALGYEDLSDHDDLRNDPLLATVLGDERRGRCALSTGDAGAPCGMRGRHVLKRTCVPVHARTCARRTCVHTHAPARVREAADPTGPTMP